MKNKIKNFLRTIYFYIRIIFLYCSRKRIDKEDYRNEYDLISENYDNLWIKNMQEYTIELIDNLEISGELKILDIACGSGFVISELAKRLRESGEIYAIDVSKRMLEIARGKSKAKNIKFIEGDAMQEIRKLPNDYFDIIICAWGFEYFEPRKILKEIKRILKENGQVAIITNRKGTLKSIEAGFLKLMKAYPSQIKKIMDIMFFLPKNEDSLKKWFISAGLIPIKVVQGEKSYIFENGIEAYKWVRDCGAVAGSGKILQIDDIANKIGNILDNYYSTKEGIVVTHKFLSGIAKK